jgi:beta-fructofuranosidase
VDRGLIPADRRDSDNVSGMVLAIPDRWVWDFWFARIGDEHHVFFLQAPHSVGHPDLRHWQASIGHAVSHDLINWTMLPDAIVPGPAGSWDDASTWTGSVLEHPGPSGGRWVMLYTGTSTGERGAVQRIGLAESDDLTIWRKHEQPVLEADPSQYETLAGGLWHDQAWRDPWLFVGPDDGQVHVFITARGKTGDTFERGVIGHARSPDLLSWDVLPPVTEPLRFGQLEVPQLVPSHGRWFLLFSSDVPTQAHDHRELGPGTGTFYLVGDAPTGPFTMIGDGVVEVDRPGSTYAGKVHLTTDGQPVFLAWHRTGNDGTFDGWLADPRPIELSADGTIRLAALPILRR